MKMTNMKPHNLKELKSEIIELVEVYNKTTKNKGKSLALLETDKNTSGFEDGTCLVKDWWSSYCYYEDPAIQWQYDCGLMEPEEDKDDY